MKQNPLAGLLALMFATAANAASLTIAPDQATYNVGDTITLTLTATTSGDSASSVRVILNHDLGLVTALGAPAPADQFTSFNGSAFWTRAAVEGSCAWAQGRDDQCLAWDQIPPFPQDTDVDDGTWTATLAYLADAPGTAVFDFQDAEGSDFIFFDLGDEIDTGTAPAGVVVNIPEPTAVALLGLGLLGLAMGGDRRR